MLSYYDVKGYSSDCVFSKLVTTIMVVRQEQFVLLLGMPRPDSRPLDGRDTEVAEAGAGRR